MFRAFSCMQYLPTSLFHAFSTRKYLPASLFGTFPSGNMSLQVCFKLFPSGNIALQVCLNNFCSEMSPCKFVWRYYHEKSVIRQRFSVFHQNYKRKLICIKIMLFQASFVNCNVGFETVKTGSLQFLIILNLR